MINWVIVAYQCNVVHCDFIYEKWKMMIAILRKYLGLRDLLLFLVEITSCQLMNAKRRMIRK